MRCRSTAQNILVARVNAPFFARLNWAWHMWLPHSSDLNLVDYAVWCDLQQMVYQRRRFTTINQLKQAIVSECGKLSLTAFHWSRHWS